MSTLLTGSMTFCSHRAVCVVGALVTLACPNALSAQMSAGFGVACSDSVVVRASDRYRAGAVHRFLMGDAYRDVWKASFTVSVLDLDCFAGGLRPTKTGGGNQTKTLRFETPAGYEYTFRPVFKDHLVQLEPFKGTIIHDLLRDGLSASFPLAPVVAAPLHQALGVPHSVPRLVVLPDDERLGEFRKEFGGRLGTIEEHTSVPRGGQGIGGALEIIDSDELLERLNRSSLHRVDAQTYLRARLLDMLINDNDRHHDQWKWGRVANDTPVVWVPIPRDRDKAFVSHEGLVLRLARIVKPSFVSYEATFPSLTALSGRAMDLDRRILVALEPAAWDSITMDVTRSISDSAIGAALAVLPSSYEETARGIGAKLRARRDSLPSVSARYRRLLFAVTPVHGTDDPDHATIEYLASGGVALRIQSADGITWLARHLAPGETRELHLYLHGGDDLAVVRGTSASGLVVRVIGGNGTNTLIDSSTTGQRGTHARLYDRGESSNTRYDPDSAFDRRPWLRLTGRPAAPVKDYGSHVQPIIGFRSERDVGLVPKIGLRRYRYGFRHAPYETMLGVEVEYSTGRQAFGARVMADHHFESSALHVRVDAQTSPIQIVQFRGFGNDVADSRDGFYDVYNRQWTVRPSIGFALGGANDISLGPVVKYSVTDSTPFTLLSQEMPYGTGRFGQAGLQLEVIHDTRDDKSYATKGVLVDIVASAYPSLWTTERPFQRIAARTSTYFKLSGSGGPVLAVRAGGERVFGTFPFYEAAFLGGSRSLRHARHQRYAGDATIFGAGELRVPLGRVRYILPWNIGALGMVEAGRVFMRGESPGGWHSALGAGFWVGVLSPGNSISVLFTNSRERRILLGTGVSF